MARILYFSTHEPLEHDDIRLFTDLGHTIFSVGRFCPANVPSDGLYRGRPDHGGGVEHLVELFRSEGCIAHFMDLGRTHLTARFINAFDVVIAVQALPFIATYWHLIERPRVIWRTVGQAIDHDDAFALHFRRQGLHIVRWSDRETRADTYIGHDAIIRAYKHCDEYQGWTGQDARIATFSNQFRQRYPIECSMTERILDGFPHAVGGGGNEDVSGAVGLLPLSEMQSLMRRSRAYLYLHGSTVPYTLNFIEAWMTGLPVIAARRDVDIVNVDMRYNEVNDCIDDGDTGFLFKSERQARAIIEDLLADHVLASRIGAAGRRMAIRLFGAERAKADWTNMFRAMQVEKMDA